MTAPVIPVVRRTLIRLPADPARTDVKLGQRAPYEGEWVERPEDDELHDGCLPDGDRAG